MTGSKRVSSSTKNDWELTGNRLLTLEIVDLTTGETAKVRAIVDMDKQQLSVECRKCGQWGNYSLETTTENEKTSGLCPSCYKKENSVLYHLGINSRGELVYINAENGVEESAILTPEQIKNHEKLLYPNVNWNIIPSGPDPFNDAKELLFVGTESEYGKAIHNISVQKDIAKMTAFEGMEERISKATLGIAFLGRRWRL
jgi:hypothetical protein